MYLKTILSVIILLSLSSAPLWGYEKPASKQAPRTVAAVPEKRGPDEQATRAYFTDLALLTQKGDQVRFYTDVLKDRVVLINFIYTHCRDACPLLVQKLNQVKSGLGNLLGDKVYFVSISTDPVRDTPQALTRFAQQQKAEHPGWVFLTGPKPNVDTILKKLGQYSPQVESHSTLFLAGNVRTRHWMKISPTAPVPAIVMKLEDLAAEN